MIPLATFQNLYDYNYWARDRQLDACAGLTPEQFLRPMGNSFSSLRDTLAYLVHAEWVWLDGWHGRPRRTMLPDDFPTLSAVRERWIEVEREMRPFLAGLTDERLAQPLTYTRMTGETKTFTLWHTLLHVVNHQTYHRGQVTTLLRQLGARPAQVDFLVYRDVRQ